MWTRYTYMHTTIQTLERYFLRCPRCYRWPTFTRRSVSQKTLSGRPDIRSLPGAWCTRRQYPGDPWSMVMCFMLSASQMRQATRVCHDARRLRRCCPGDPTFDLATRGVPDAVSGNPTLLTTCGVPDVLPRNPTFLALGVPDAVCTRQPELLDTCGDPDVEPGNPARNMGIFR